MYYSVREAKRRKNTFRKKTKQKTNIFRVSEVVIDFAGTEWQKALERGTKSPWTWHFTTLGLHMEPVSASRLFEPLRESGQAPPSVENRSGASVCTREQMTAGKEMLMIFYGQ